MVAVETKVHGPECHKAGIRGYGDPSSGVILIGIAPGKNEIRDGIPFTGQSGKLLDSILKGIGWHRDKTYCTNTICWFNNDPTYTEAKPCLQRLHDEVGWVKPKLIVTLGRIPCEYFLMQDLTKTRGAIQWNEDLNCYTLATYHPAAILHGTTSLIHDLIRDLAKIPLVLGREWSKITTPVSYSVVSSREEAQSVLTSLDGSGYYALDIETSSAEADEDVIDVFQDRLLCLAISDGVNTWVFPSDVCTGLSWPKGVHWIFHNGMFDTQGLKRYLDVDLPIVEDTLLMNYSLDERKKRGLNKLKNLAREYCASGWYEEETKKFRKGKLHLVPTDKLHEYNAKDAAYTARLYHIFRGKQGEDEVRGFYERILIPAANAFKEIQLRGVHVDTALMDALAREWTPRFIQEEKELQALAEDLGWDGKEPINLSSPVQLSKFLYSTLGLPGGPSTKKEVLEQLSHPFAQRLMKHRQMEHMLSTYLLGVKDDIKRDGRVHANVLLHGTVTGRLSYSDPPLQTIPKESKVGEDLGRIKQIFCATNDRYTLIEADYEKAEVWGAYAHSQDPNLLADLQSGDYHKQVASRIFNKALSEVTKADKDNAKPVTFGGPNSYAEVKPAQLLEPYVERYGNQQPEQIVISVNGSETDSTSESDVVCAA